jgi:serine/threonine protein kinase
MLIKFTTLRWFIQSNISLHYNRRCGTPGYTAPEILNYNEGDDFYNEKCDMFSLGVIFYLLLVNNKF